MIKHFTVTVYVVAWIDSEYKILLHKHKKLGIWIGVGGHIEKDENPVEASVREAYEETNLNVEVVAQNNLYWSTQAKEIIAPIAVFEQIIPKFANEPEHIHVDFAYVAKCKKPQSIKMQEEYRWFGKSELEKSILGKEVVYLVKKILEKNLLNSL